MANEFTVVLAVPEWIAVEHVGRIIEQALEDYDIVLLEIEED